jgi:hypothetical protein
MAWQNIFELGDVDLLLEVGGAPGVPIGEVDLDGGTIEAVDGLIQFRNMPNDGINRKLVAVPRFERSEDLPVRITASNVDIPREFPDGTFSPAVHIEPAGNGEVLVPVFEGEGVDQVCVAFSNSPIEPAELLPADQGSGDELSGIGFSFAEAGS